MVYEEESSLAPALHVGQQSCPCSPRYTGPAWQAVLAAISLRELFHLCLASTSVRRRSIFPECRVSTCKASSPFWATSTRKPCDSRNDWVNFRSGSESSTNKIVSDPRVVLTTGVLAVTSVAGSSTRGKKI